MVVTVAPDTRLRSERTFFTGMALAMAAATLIGFAPTYYLAAFNDAKTPTLTPSVHVHGALSTAWILLLIVQTRLIAVGRRDLHRLAGLAGTVIAAVTVVVGFFVAIHSERRVHTPATADTLADPYVFLIFPFSSIGAFALFTTLGAWTTRALVIGLAYTLIWEGLLAGLLEGTRFFSIRQATLGIAAARTGESGGGQPPLDPAVALGIIVVALVGSFVLTTVALTRFQIRSPD